MKMHSIFLLLITILSSLSAQEKEPNWTRIQFDYSSRMYVDVNSINKFNSDILVWTMEENFPPLTIESVREKIYKTKTFYLFNTELKKYSFLEVIYYDAEDNVLESFSYRRNTEVDSYQYNYPIISGSIQEAILIKCIYLNKGTK